MDYNNLQKMVAEVEKELNDLKTIQGGIKYMTSYTKNYTNGATGLSNQVLEVVYDSGDGTIFSDILGSNFATPLEIIGNRQRFFLRQFYANQTISISSNRPIISITNITQ